jgi:hypothetical protein
MTRLPTVEANGETSSKVKRDQNIKKSRKTPQNDFLSYEISNESYKQSLKCVVNESVFIELLYLVIFKIFNRNHT